MQPIIGLFSDKTWTRLGRRIPFILAGAIISAFAMFFMPNSEFFAHLLPPVLFAAFILLFMDTSFNVTMQPFRALVGDMVSEEQRNIGYSIQSFLINSGAVIGSLLPMILTYLGVSNVPAEGQKIASSVIWSFYLGGSILFLSVLWTSFRTKEYPPAEYDQYNETVEIKDSKKPTGSLLKNIPTTMWQLAIVQFFSWFALFMMWVYTNPGVAQNIWKTTDSLSADYNESRNWVGLIFAMYSLFGALFSIVMARLANSFGRKPVYMLSLLLGGIGLLSMMFIQDKYGLIVSMIGVGIAWAAILAMPYAILSGVLPAKRMGIYMGLFNATITIPQIAAGFLGGFILTALGGKPINMLGVAGISMLLAGISVVFVKSKKTIQ